VATFNELIDQQGRVSAAGLSKYLSKGQDYSVVDFPDYSNVGDSAIWLGTLVTLSGIAGRQPAYVCTVEAYSRDDLQQQNPSGPIFINGGGNFGDIYPKHQDFRLRLMADFPDRAIIQLPQSISFSKPEAAQPTAQAIARHGKFTMLVRDQPSVDFVRQHFDCPVALLPDMAFGMGPLKRRGAPASPIFMLLREDTERAGYDRQPLLARPDAVAADWLDEPQQFRRLTRWKTRLAMFGRGGLHSPQGRLTYYRLLAQGRLERGLRMLSSGKFGVTDRLHAHILSTMLDIPHVVLDNSYRKINNYMDAWTGRYEQVRRADSAPEVIEHLRTWGL
jgi:exopolysaccharide biosynthesis predicted pyruvyltransferase EpsI